MSDTQSFKHGEDGTHWCCQNRIRDEGGKAMCCECRPHDGCGNDTHTDEELLEQVEEIKNFCRINYAPDARVSDEYEEQWTSRVKRLIADRERAAKKLESQ